MERKRLSDAIRPKLSTEARKRVIRLIEDEELMDETQNASDLQFLLDFHDNVHAAAEGKK